MEGKIAKVFTITICLTLFIVSCLPVASASVTTDQHILDLAEAGLPVGVKIITPLDGFKQADTDMLVVGFVFKIRASEDVSASDVKIRVDGYISNGRADMAKFGYVGNGYAIGSYRVSGNTGYGAKTLTVRVTDQFGVTHTATLRFTNFEGFIDVDGDGKDDRVGRDDYSHDPANPTQPAPDPVELESVPWSDFLSLSEIRMSVFEPDDRKLIDGFPHAVFIDLRRTDLDTGRVDLATFAIWFAVPATLKFYIYPYNGHDAMHLSCSLTDFKMVYAYKYDYTEPNGATGSGVSQYPGNSDYVYSTFPDNLIGPLTKNKNLRLEFLGVETFGSVVVVGEDDKELVYQGPQKLADFADLMDEGVTITLPRNGFSQSQIDTITLWFYFKIPVPPGANKDDIQVNVDGYLPGTRETLSSEFYISNGYAIGMYRVVGNTGFGENKVLTVKVTDPTGKVWKKSVSVNCFMEFVDTDGDGYDDRAGDDYWDRNVPTTSPWGGFVGHSAEFDLSSAVKGVSGFLQGLYSIIPPQILSIVVAGIGFLLILAIKRLVL